MFKPGLARMKVTSSFHLNLLGMSSCILGIIIFSLAPACVDHNYDLTKEHVFGNFMVSKYFLNGTIPSKIISRSLF